jgi:hypothetical protein
MGGAGDGVGVGVGVAETHIGIVFLVGERAYKLKKPVEMGFLDFTTREARHRACLREVELNRRLAPDVYLGVSDVTDVDGEVCDHLVVMRRMPAERRLSALVTSGAVTDVEDGARALARLLARFHAAAASGPHIDAAATASAVLGNWEDNVAQMAPSVGGVLDGEEAGRVAEMARRYVAGREALFAHRIESGRVRDGHGDLLADDIFLLDDGPRVLDCIEFDDRLRYGDVLADVAFLAMDLERLGAGDVGVRFLAWYREFSGETWPDSLAHHYVAYRAHVRAKVACLRVGQGDDEAADQARDLLAMTHDHLDAARVRLVVVGGLPGTGKSTLAAALGDARGWTVLRSDVIRKELGGGRADFTEEATAATYAEVLRRARRLLGMGESVVLDASWTAASHRAAARLAAADAFADLVELRCDVDAATAAARLVERARRGDDPSEATPDVAAAMAAAAEPWPEATVVSTAPAVDVVLATALPRT